MRLAYFFIRILLVVVITAVIINFLLVFNPFSFDKTANDKVQQKIEGPGFEKGTDISNEKGIKEDRMGEEPEVEDEIIGFSGSDLGEDTGKEFKKNDKNVDKDYFLTYDEIMSIENVSFSDKLFGLSVLRKIDRADLERILRLADGGVTQDEWTVINAIMKKQLSERDIDRVKEVIDKSRKLCEDNKLAKK